MTIHTQGPWLICKNDSLTIYSANKSGNDTAVCVAESGNGILEAQANARLIASAPNMLNALQEADKTITNELAAVKLGKYSPELMYDILCQINGDIRAAIAKATGV